MTAPASPESSQPCRSPSPPEVQAIIENEIDSGRFDTAEEVVIEALRHFQDAATPMVPEEWLVDARAQADRGEVVPWTDDFMERSARRARANAAQGHKVSDEVKY